MPESFNPQFWDHLDQLVESSEVVIDRPRDSQHPDIDDIIYPLDYGYLAGTTSSDGAGIDVWLGESGDRRPNAVVCSVDLVKRDLEMKILLGCSEGEMRIIVSFINERDQMHCLLVRREE